MTRRFKYRETLSRQVKCRAGFSLVEIMMTMLVLVILSIAGGLLVNRGQIDAGIQKHKRAAIEAANGEMERVVRGIATNSVAGTLTTNISLNSITGFVMRTTIADAGTNADNCYKVTVSVEYRKGGDTVQLETYRSR